MRPGRMLMEVLKHIFRKPATAPYPQNKSGMPEGFRGKLGFSPEKCVGCRLCMKDCPSGAITILKKGEKVFEAQISLGKCIYCGQCVDSCMKKALSITGQFELAQLENASLEVILDEKPDQGTPEQT